MATTDIYQELVFKLAANEEIQLDISGSYLACLENTGAFKIRVDNGPMSTFQRGLKIESNGGPWGRFFLRDVSGAANTITLATGTGGFSDSRVNFVGGVLDVAQVLGDALAAAAVTVGTAATLLAAADDERKSLTLRNQGATDLFIGPAGVTAADGFPVAAGEAFTLDRSTAAVYGIRASGSYDVRTLAEA